MPTAPAHADPKSAVAGASGRLLLGTMVLGAAVLLADPGFAQNPPPQTVAAQSAVTQTADTRNLRVNFQVIEVDRSPASSLFGFYVGGQRARPCPSRCPCCFDR